MKTFAFARIIAPGLLLATAACGLGGGDPLANAEEAFAERDYHAARLELAKALKETPDDQRALYLNAKTLLALGDGVSARYAISKLAADGPYAAEKPLLLGEAALAEQKFDEALRHAEEGDGPEAARIATLALMQLDRPAEGIARLEAGIAAHPGDARLLALRGALALAERKLSLAKDYSARALAADGEALDALMLAGQLRVMRQDYAGAREFYARAVEHNPSSLDALFALAATEADRGEGEAARKLLDDVLARAPGHPLAVLLQAKLDFADGKLDPVRATLRQNERLLAELPEGRLLMGEVAHLDGLHQQAIAHLREVLKAYPGHAQASTVLAQSFDATGEKAEAFATIRPIADRATASPQALALASRLADSTGADNPYKARRALQRDGEYVALLRTADRALSNGENEKAASQYDTLRARGGDGDPLVLNNAAVALDRLGRKGEAFSLAQRAHALTPDDPQVQDTLGWTMLRAGGNKARALSLIRSASNAVPGNLQIRWHLANALAENGQRAEAKRLIADIREFAAPQQRAEFDRLLARL
ncbi:tetratricopeptide repeat protein [Alteriqipengyuania sp. WL0013]|uniref:tetratricopeptide repeat protein n=1 Tax=Alteriqipengyuania sp. WL0013 TaxID=3110773 RepID=UPI002C470066|nr:tetratricopeptide repeat protein [Alteriqipengyuania sp. WL0013]MEB3416076.1 tetratricopeptide repeat protein [Alteriqipengyuania sp. WL0013]